MEKFEVPGHVLWAVAGALMASGEADSLEGALQRALWDLHRLFETQRTLRVQQVPTVTRALEDAVVLDVEDLFATTVVAHRSSPGKR